LGHQINQLFVEEVSNALVEEETVRLNDRRAALNRPLEKVSIPNTVKAVLRARLDRLDDYTHESLRLVINLAEELNMINRQPWKAGSLPCVSVMAETHFLRTDLIVRRSLQDDS
jgi:hypothetical protein